MLYYDLPVQDMILKKGELKTQDLDEVSFPYLRHAGIPMRMHRILDTDALHMRYWVWKAGHAFGFATGIIRRHGYPQHHIASISYASLSLLTASSNQSEPSTLMVYRGARESG